MRLVWSRFRIQETSGERAFERSRQQQKNFCKEIWRKVIYLMNGNEKQANRTRAGKEGEEIDRMIREREINLEKSLSEMVRMGNQINERRRNRKCSQGLRKKNKVIEKRNQIKSGIEFQNMQKMRSYSVFEYSLIV